MFKVGEPSYSLSYVSRMPRCTYCYVFFSSDPTPKFRLKNLQALKDGVSALSAGITKMSRNFQIPLRDGKQLYTVIRCSVFDK